MRMTSRAFNLVATTFIVTLLAAGDTLAHHSVASQHDLDKQVELTGVIAGVEWTSPHVRLQLELEAEHQGRVSWLIEMGAPQELRREGWAREDLRIGQGLQILGAPAKDGSKRLNASRIIGVSPAGDAVPRYPVARWSLAVSVIVWMFVTLFAYLRRGKQGLPNRHAAFVALRRVGRPA